MIFRWVRPDKVNQWIIRNYPASINGTPGDSWRKFLSDHGGTGETYYDLESSYFANNTGALTFADKLSVFVANAGYTVGVIADRARAYFDATLVSAGNHYLLENGVDRYLLEDGSGLYTLE